MRELEDPNEDFCEPIQPRDALYGGRTEAFRLTVFPEDLGPGDQMAGIDYTSLYPAVVTAPPLFCIRAFVFRFFLLVRVICYFN